MTQLPPKRNQLPTFRLFADPVGEESFERTDEECELCGKARGWAYTLEPNCEDEEPECICPWCIADGTAEAAGLSFNDPTVYPALEGSPQLSPEDAAEVEFRTPGFVTWQEHGWMMCCGRACRYLGEAKGDDLRGRWAGAVESILSNTHDAGWSAEQRAELIAQAGEDAGPCAYVFECVACGKLSGFWDDA